LGDWIDDSWSRLRDGSIWLRDLERVPFALPEMEFCIRGIRCRQATDSSSPCLSPNTLSIHSGSTLLTLFDVLAINLSQALRLFVEILIIIDTSFSLLDPASPSKFHHNTYKLRGCVTRLGEQRSFLRLVRVLRFNGTPEVLTNKERSFNCLISLQPSHWNNVQLRLSLVDFHRSRSLSFRFYTFPFDIQRHNLPGSTPLFAFA
jgi:hypothetical protein